MLCAVVLLCVVSLNFAVQPRVLVQPISRTAHPGTTVKFSCEGQAEDGKSTLNINDDLVVGVTFENRDILQEYQNRSFSWEKSSENGQITRWDVEILANAQNNNTRMVCYFESKITDEAVLVVVEGPPDPPSAPEVATTNLTALTLTWTAPWPHPISNYTVSMLNLTSGEATQWTVLEERYILTVDKEQGQCDELVFTVEAETDVGSSGVSLNTTGGFPSSIAFMDEAELEMKLKKTENRKGPILGIQFEPPDVCYYQTLSYIYEIKNREEDHVVLHTLTTSTNMTVSREITFNVKYMLNLTINNAHLESYSVLKNFTFERLNPTSTIAARTTSKQRSDHPQNSQFPTEPFVPTDESLIVIAVIPGLLVALIAFPVLFLLSWWLCVCRAQRNRVLQRTLSTKPFVPPMAKNPIYDGAEPGIYEFIPVFTGLDSIDFPEAPPNLPPPRRATMDINIGQKHTGDSTEDVVTPIIESPTIPLMSPSPTVNPTTPDADGGEQYIVMNSSTNDTTATPPNGSPRYTEPPSLGSQPHLENRKFSCDLPSQSRTDNSDGYDRLATL